MSPPHKKLYSRVNEDRLSSVNHQRRTLHHVPCVQVLQHQHGRLYPLTLGLSGGRHVHLLGRRNLFAIPSDLLRRERLDLFKHRTADLGPGFTDPLDFDVVHDNVGFEEEAELGLVR